MLLQSTTQIGDIIRNATIFNVKNWLGDTMDSDSLLHSIEQLFTLLKEREIDYVLVGGIALLHYVEGRNTEDIDLIMALSDLEKMPEIKISSQDMYFARGDFDQLQIDLLLTKNPLFKHVQKNHLVFQHFLEQDIPFATVEGLLLLKLYALPSLYRQGNFARVGIYENDIASLIHDYKPDISKIIKQLNQHLSESDLIEIKAIIHAIEEKIKRFQRDN